MKILKLFFVFLLLITLRCNAAEALLGDMRFVTPAQLVDIGDGRRMNLLCEGSGTPTVILESGAGGGLSGWMVFQTRIAQHTRVCSYDRAGFGFSDRSLRGITSITVTDDLHRLLVAADVEPPYVMVGHSLGGMYVRHFAAKYLDEVAGLVLIDPFTEDQARRYWQLDPASKLLDDEETARLRDCLVLSKANFNGDAEKRAECIGGLPGPRFNPEFNAAYEDVRARPEYFEAKWLENLNNFSLSTFQMLDVDRQLGDRPLIVLTRNPRVPVPDETEEMRALREAKNACMGQPLLENKNQSAFTISIDLVL